MSEVLKYETRRRREYEARKARRRGLDWAVVARGYACPDCLVSDAHPVHLIDGERLGVECGSEWCGREFTIFWRPAA